LTRSMRTPVITISVLADKTDDSIIADIPKAVVANITTEGFTIVLERYVLEDIRFSWMALSVGEVEETVGDSSVKEAVEILTSEESTESSTPGESSGHSGSDLEVTPSAEATPLAEVEITP